MVSDQHLLYLAGDESGSLTNPHTAIVTMAMIITRNPQPLRWIIPRAKRRIRRKSPKRGKTSEFKFHNTTDLAHAAVLGNLARENVEIVAFSIFKGSQVIEDTPENYGLLLCNLIERCVIPDQQSVEFTFDRHHTKRAPQDALNALARGRSGLDKDMQFVDSQRNHMTQLADFVAGAIHYARTGKSPIFYDLIRSRIVGDELQLWKDARREWLERK